MNNLFSIFNQAHCPSSVLITRNVGNLSKLDMHVFNKQHKSTGTLCFIDFLSCSDPLHPFYPFMFIESPFNVSKTRNFYFFPYPFAIRIEWRRDGLNILVNLNHFSILTCVTYNDPFDVSTFTEIWSPLANVHLIMFGNTIV